LDPSTLIETGEERAQLVERCAWSLVWLGVASSGLLYWGSWSQWPGAGLFAPLLVTFGIVGATILWSRGRAGSTAMQVAGLIAAELAVVLPAGTLIQSRQFFTTDSAAFTQLATQLFLHGRNPYTSSMSSAALHPIAHYWTYLANGGHVTQFSYPAGSFVLQLPLMALGLRHALTDWVGLFSWLAIGVLLFVMVPRSVRWLAPLVLMSSLLVGLFANGGSDALFILMMLLAGWRWDRFGMGRAAGLAGWLGPLAMGLACSVKQTPWFALPFFVIGVAIEGRRRGGRGLILGARYLATVLAVFAAFNLPFLIWNASAWFHGAFLPFTEPLVADGQGLITLALHGLTGGVVLAWLSLAGALVYVALLLALVFWYPVLKRSWLFLLPVVLMIPSRSFSSYLIGFVPIALVAAITANPARAIGDAMDLDRLRERSSRWIGPVLVALPLAIAALLVVLAFSSAPLEVAVERFSTSGHSTVLRSVTVKLTNTTGQSLVPEVLVDLRSPHPNGFWLRADGRVAQPLAPGASVTITYIPSALEWAPLHGQFWLVDVYTTSPTALSTSPAMRWKLGDY
jgi:hypothetical protein